MAKKSRDYFGLSGLISLILAIFAPTAWICGVVTRFQEGNLLAVVIRIIFGPIIWIADVLSMIFTGRIFRLL